MSELINPVVPGFKYECSRCGKCCTNRNVLLTMDEFSWFKQHAMFVAYTITISKEKGNILSIYGCKPPDVACDALYENPQTHEKTCLIYPHRPFACKIYPLLMRTYYHNPPSFDELKKSLKVDSDLKQYVHQIGENRWVVLGYPDRDCPGLGKGHEWDRGKIVRYISNQLYSYVDSKEKSNETSDQLIDHFALDKKSNLKKYFTLDRIIFEDDKIQIGVYNAINRTYSDVILDSIDMSGLNEDVLP